MFSNLMNQILDDCIPQSNFPYLFFGNNILLEKVGCLHWGQLRSLPRGLLRVCWPCVTKVDPPEMEVQM